MSQSQSSQGDRSPNISNVEGDANIDASQDSRATQIEKNAIKGTGYAEEIKGSSYTGKNTYVDSTHIEVLPPPSPFKSDFPSNLPLIYSSNFVGREQALETLHEQLESQAGVEISAPSKVASVEGMGGIGKTELALQYALRYGEESYKGGVLWLSVRDRNVGIQIVDFARNQLGLTLPEETELEKLVQFCWGHWPGGDRVLVVWDDVGEFQQIKPFLPPNRSRFKMVITTRKKGLSHSFGSLVLEVLEEDAALALLAALAGEERIAAELEMAKELCAWLGYLPLGLELVGQYLAERQDLSLAEMKGRLEKKGLEQKALREYTAEATAQRGVKAAFELSWQELSAEAKEVACLLSLFAVAPISWEWVQGCLEWDEEDLEDVRDGVLVKFSLLQRLDAGWYQLHSLLQMFMRGKLEEFAEAEKLKRQYCRVMVIASQQMPETPTLEQVEEFSVLVPHLEEVTARWCNFVEDEDLIDPFTQIARYYEGQGLYSQAELWYKQCLSGVRDRLGEEHPYIASSLNNLAGLYHSQGRYEEAEICSLQDLEISRKLLGEENPHVASSLNTLAALYYSQGKYLEAEPLYLQALELRKKLLGKENFYVASSLNNLAELYRSQGRYQEAELLYLQVLELLRKLLGEEHPRVAQSLSNLALLYYAQRRYQEAEPLCLQALELRKKLLGEEHPHVTESLNNLAELYRSQGRYQEAEPLCLQALELRKKLLGDEHPYVASSLNNLAFLYKFQGKYSEAELLFLQAFEIFRSRLGFEHPSTQKVRKNFVDCLQSAVAAGQKDRLSNHPITQQLLAQIVSE